MSYMSYQLWLNVKRIAEGAQSRAPTYPDTNVEADQDQSGQTGQDTLFHPLIKSSSDMNYLSSTRNETVHRYQRKSEWHVWMDKLSRIGAQLTPSHD